MARIQARAAAMQLLYERLEGGSAEETLGELIGFTQETSGDETAFSEDKVLIDSLVDGVTAKADELDQLIAGYLRGWTLDRIARVDLCILRPGDHQGSGGHGGQVFHRKERRFRQRRAERLPERRRRCR